MNYRDAQRDPLWHQAQERYVNPPGNNADERFIRSLLAAKVMWEVERRDAVSDAEREQFARLLEVAQTQ